MARNEDGEFELMLGNKQLLSVFFLMVVLLTVCFIGGYLLGRSAAPVVTASNAPPQVIVPPTVPSQANPEPAPESSTPPARTAPQVSEPVAEKAPEPVKETAPAPKQTAKVEPKAKAKDEPKAKAKEEAKAKTKEDVKAKAAVPAKQGPASSQPVAGRIYLQLSATDKDKAEVMVDLLRRKNFAAIAAPVAERAGLFRVLVGPLAENALTQTKAQLKAGGFPGDEAIRRVF